MFFSGVFGIVSAVVGAGFASGREIMRFFSRYGSLSWALCVLAAAIMGCLTAWVMEDGNAFGPYDRKRKLPEYGNAFFLLLFAGVGGAMTAAAGELCALTVPLRNARLLGGMMTVCASAFASRRAVRILGAIGRILVPLMLLAFFLCVRVPPEPGKDFSPPGLGQALIGLVGYCGLNGILSSGVIREAGQCCPAREQRRIAILASALLCVLLLAGNAAMAPHASALNRAALPVVSLLRAYGKVGFYLSAAVLYLAVFSTLTAILRTMRALAGSQKHPAAWAGLLCALFSLIGFEEIVGLVYPVLGWLGILLISGRKFFKCGTKRRVLSSIGGTRNKEGSN